MAKKKKISEAMSLVGFNLWELTKGQRKAVIAMISALLMLWITDAELVSLVSGIIVSAIFSLAEFYFKEVELE